MHGSPTVDGQLSEQGVTPERMCLLLPSSLSMSLCHSIGLLALVDKEFQLQRAHADDALVSLWQSLASSGTSSDKSWISLGASGATPN